MGLLEVLRDKLTEKGFEVFIYESPIDKMMKQMQAGEEVFAGEDPVDSFCDIFDMRV